MPLSHRAAVLAASLLFAQPTLADPTAILDNEGFAQQMTAATITLPPGWQGNGRVAWNKPCSGNEFYEILFSATSPDGQSGLRIMPGHLINWNDVDVTGVDPYIAQMSVAQADALRNDQRTQFRNSNCHVGQVTSTQQLIDNLILAKRPAGAKVTAIEPNEALRATYAQTFANQPGGKTYYDAVIVHLTYPGANGPVAERDTLSWYMFTDDPAMQVAGMPRIIYQATFVDPITLIWAPADRPADLALAEAALKGMQADTTWLAKVREVQNARNQQRQKDRAEANAAAAAANKARQEAADKQHAAFIDMIRQ